VAEGEDRNNIDLIKNLVKEHIAGNTLILLAITMRGHYSFLCVAAIAETLSVDDLENQSAAFLAKEADPSGLRTIGVLTKPDTLQEGEHKTWLDVLEGYRHPLKHGYFVTKQPGPTDLEKGTTFDKARKEEKAFFEKGFWASANVAAKTKTRMGIPKLTAELSKLLSGLIDKTYVL
jgi:hypothetical protein